ncbi:unnamed protein product [Cylicostephanus goldi]|uniref:Uncharacterized protein n=1 Tax=Cylicostephanus goldi TaxID=71465 RepID=A0A3P6S8D3_CYLGO|nr:unnamed protein product [Cylicostephanus goldi]
MIFLFLGAQLVAINKARYYRRGDDLALGAGPFVAAIEFATGKQQSDLNNNSDTMRTARCPSSADIAVEVRNSCQHVTDLYVPGQLNWR